MTSDGDHTKARLLAHARDMYLVDGLGRFSLREVARRAKVSAAAVYRHYDGKEALLRDVCAQGFRIFYSYLMRSLAARTPKERMLRCASEYLCFGLENPRDYRFIFMSSKEDFIAIGPPEGQETDPTFQFLVDRVEECQRARVIRKGDARELAMAIWVNVHGLVSLRLSGHLDVFEDDLAFGRFYDRSTQALMDAMKG
jgi:AcrR family transcriptional regulator